MRTFRLILHRSVVFWLFITFFISYTACSDTEELDSLTLVEKIINGQPEHGQPAVAVLLVGQAPRCTGTLIAQQVVLTAAHCIETESRNNFTTVAFVAAGFTVDQVEVSDMVMHTGWFGQNGEPPNVETTLEGNDIGLIYLRRPAQVRPVDLDPTPPGQQLGRLGQVVGFGLREANDQSSLGAKYAVTLRVKQFKGSLFSLESSDRQARAACRGDSGGPLLINGLAGIASTANCYNQSEYTPIYHHRDWIQSNLESPQFGRRKLSETPLETQNGVVNTDAPRTNQTSTRTANCPDIINCLYTRCPADDVECHRGCYMDAGTQSVVYADELVMCINASECGPNWGCVQSRCPQQDNACRTTAYDFNHQEASVTPVNRSAPVDVQPTAKNCSTLVNCLRACSSDSTCIQRCADESSTEAIRIYNNAVQCVSYWCSGAVDRSGCANSMCAVEINMCEGHL